jgi:hypothetical protein
VNGARRVSADATSFGRRTLPVALLLAEAEAEVVHRLRVEPALDFTAQKDYDNG